MAGLWTSAPACHVFSHCRGRRQKLRDTGLGNDFLDATKKKAKTKWTSPKTALVKRHPVLVSTQAGWGPCTPLLQVRNGTAVGTVPGNNGQQGLLSSTSLLGAHTQGPGQGDPGIYTAPSPNSKTGVLQGTMGKMAGKGTLTPATGSLGSTPLSTITYQT